MTVSYKKIINIFSLSPERHQKVKNQIAEEAKGDLDFYVLSVLSGVIITFGLIIDNTAMVIGGMLLAPLVWPMLALGLAITRGSIRSLESSLFTIVKISVVIIITSFLIGWVSPFNEFGREVLSRTQPTIVELMVAFCAGFVAAFVIGHPGLGSFIAGVVIAAAIVPPLCVAGLSIAHQNLAQAGGAFLLFTSNLIAIILSSTIYFLLAKFKPIFTKEGRKRRISNIIWLLVFLMVILIPLLVITKDIISQNKQYYITQKTLLANLKEGKIAELELKEKDDVLFITATLRAERNLTSWELDYLADHISQALNKSVNLQITVIPTMQGGKIIEAGPAMPPADADFNQNQIFPKTKQ
ncbi:DUF389 domain-containing protein [Patescibacteria group bacterium]|nr:DUF389 domain-containing protein [Patescibacteria group bacterium]